MSAVPKIETQASTGLLRAVAVVWVTVAILAGALLVGQFAPAHPDFGRFERAFHTLSRGAGS
jgi:hypothetical protein